MKIRGWRIDGFGIFNDAVVEDLPGGLTIVSGPNEAGKSTLLAFLRGVLFGFPDGRSRARRHDPVRGGRHGGAVVLDDGEGGLWTVERYADPRALVVRRPDGTLAEDHELTDLLGHADATLFGNVFAFGLSELDGFDLLDSDAVRDRVFSAGVVGAGRSAREAIESLDARRSVLVRPRGRCVVRDLADEARVATRALARAQAVAADRGRRRDDVDRLAELAESRRAAIDACRAEQLRLRSLIELWPIRNRLAAIDDELDGSIEPPDLDEESVIRFEEVRAELTAASLARESADLDLATAIERRDATVADPSLAEIGPAIRALAPELGAEESRVQRLSELDREVDLLRDQLDEQLRRLGPDWDRAHLAGLDLSIPTADDVRRRGADLDRDEAQLASLRAERDELVAARAAAEAEASEIEARLDESDPDAVRADHERRARSLRQLRAGLVDLGAATARLDAAERTVAGLRAVMPKAAVPSSGATVGTGLVGVGVVLLLLAGAVSFGGMTRLTLVLGVAGATLSVLGASVLLTRRSVVRPDQATRDLTSEISEAEAARREAQSRVSTLRTSVEAAALVLGLPADPSALDVEEAAGAIDEAAAALRSEEDERARLAELGTAVDEVTERVAPLDLAITTLTLTVDRQRDEWAAWKVAHRVPDGLGVEAINDLFTTLERSRTTERTLRGVERERAALDEASSRFRATAAALLARAGIDDDGDDLLADVRTLVERAEADARSRQALEERTAAVEEAEAGIEAVYDRVAVARAEHAELLARAGADDEVGFRAAVQRWRRARELAVERESGWERIHAVVGHGDAAASLLAELDRGDPSGWEVALEAAAAHLPELVSQHEDAIRMHHDADRSLEEMSRSADVPEASQQVEVARTRLADAVSEWQSLTAARHLLVETLARYERERQPAVLARAEAMFATVTDGHHRSLSVVDGDLTIVDRDGRRLTAGDLSRGTAEQLYLCVRFGLAAEMAVRSPLPFVMDDVLVNFDPERMARMAGVVAELARAHQVLVFTCQPTSRDALEAAVPDARVIELPRHGRPAG